MECGKCGTNNPPDAINCEKCGAALSDEPVFREPYQDPSKPKASSADEARIITTTSLSREEAAASEAALQKGSRKKGFVVVALIAVIAVALGAGYFGFFHHKTVDISAAYRIDFEGYDGRGSVQVKRDVSKTGLDRSSAVLRSIDYNSPQLSKQNGTLSNGDQIIVQLDYNKNLAEKERVIIQGDSRTVTVEGLTTRYDNAKEVNRQAIEYAIEKAPDAARVNALADGMDTVGSSELKEVYFVRDKKELDDFKDKDASVIKFNDSLVLICEVKGTDQKGKKVIQYYDVTVSGVNSSYEPEDYDRQVKVSKITAKKAGKAGKAGKDLKAVKDLKEALAALQAKDYYPEKLYVWYKVQ